MRVPALKRYSFGVNLDDADASPPTKVGGFHPRTERLYNALIFEWQDRL